MRGRGRGGAELFPRLLLDSAPTPSRSRSSTRGQLSPGLPPHPRQTARSPHSRANLTFRGGGCISTLAKAASDSGTRQRPAHGEAPPQTWPDSALAPPTPCPAARRARKLAGAAEPLNLCYCCEYSGRVRAGLTLRPLGCRENPGFLSQDAWVLFLV